jgi:hypothetical protein
MWGYGYHKTSVYLFTSMNPTINITREAYAILETIRDTGSKYGLSYTICLLRGDVRFGLKHDTHSKLPHYALMHNLPADKIRNHINYLLLQGYLFVRTGEFATLGLTVSGIDALNTPTIFSAEIADLNHADFLRRLYDGLHHLRRALVEQYNTPPYHVFSNKSIRSIVQVLPTNLSMLKYVEGLSEQQINMYGTSIVTLSADIAREIRAVEVREAEARYRAGEVDMLDWIEARLDARALYKGIEYFSQTHNLRLEDAYTVLGLDYNTLRLCRLYVESMEASKTQLSQCA